VYDISTPGNSYFVTYFNNRNFTAPIATSGDLGPESIRFVNSADSPTGKPLLLVGNEISGTTSVYSIKVNRRQRNWFGPQTRKTQC
jgi:5'-nucleotidase